MTLDGMVAIHTLGPDGTNCQKAARFWRDARALQCDIVLHESLEAGAGAAVRGGLRHVMPGCVVYPDLHELVFSNLTRLSIIDCFVAVTDDMVLAAPAPALALESIMVHPARLQLAPARIPRRIIASSNAAAAAACARGEADSCITTEVAAHEMKLTILERYGPLSMGFTIHGVR